MNGCYVTTCYSETRQGQCKLRFSIPIILIIIACNAAKALSMFLTYLYARDATLVTLGDAIASFLDAPDKTTTNLCLASKNDIKELWRSPRRPIEWKSDKKELITESAHIWRWRAVNSSLVSVFSDCCHF